MESARLLQSPLDAAAFTGALRSSLAAYLSRGNAIQLCLLSDCVVAHRRAAPRQGADLDILRCVAAAAMRLQLCDRRRKVLRPDVVAEGHEDELCEADESQRRRQAHDCERLDQRGGRKAQEQRPAEQQRPHLREAASLVTRRQADDDGGVANRRDGWTWECWESVNVGSQ